MGKTAVRQPSSRAATGVAPSTTKRGSRQLEIPIGEIKVPKNRATRPLGDVAGLMASIREVGLLSPIQVTSGNILIAGRHRLEACRKLGLVFIPATVHHLDELRAELATIDENLVRAELTPIERGEQLARQKELHEALHPESRNPNVRGGPGRGKKTVANLATVFSGAKAAAGKTGASERTVRREIQIATKIAPAVKEKLRGSKLERNQSELEKLSRENHVNQAAIVEKLTSGDAKTFHSAKAQVTRESIARRIGEEGQPKGLTRDLVLRVLGEGRGKFRTVYLDPPWEYADGGSRGAAEGHYPVMSLDELADLPVGDLAHADGCHVWMWCTWPKLRDGHAHRLFQRWGLDWKSELLWIKDGLGMGRWLRKSTELLILATKGDQKLLEADQVDHLRAASTGRHSAKPQIFREMIERLSAGPRIELFARGDVPGDWYRWGLEAK